MDGCGRHNYAQAWAQMFVYLNKFLYTVYSNRRNSKKPLDEERNNLDARTSRVLELTLGLICRPASPSNVSAKRQNILLPAVPSTHVRLLYMSHLMASWVRPVQ